MSIFNIEFIENYLPKKETPFGSILKELFSGEKMNDLAIHYPNVIRGVTDIMLHNGQHLEKECSTNNYGNVVLSISNEFHKFIEIFDMTEADSRDKTIESLQIAALYHDIGKLIRQANHPRLGVNIIRNMHDDERLKLVNGLKMNSENAESAKNEHRFSLLCSIVDHHDKFGVVSTGEGSLAIFSDILYFRSDERTIDGIKKNITSVMILNLADIAAVCTASKDTQKRASELVSCILKNNLSDQSNEYKEVLEIWNDKNSFLGLSNDKVKNILDDWKELILAIENKDVRGDRTKLREYLISLDQNPFRTIMRFIRILKESCYTTNCNALLPCISETEIESTLVSSFGAHQFQDFCIKFAYIAKMDYGLKFFKGILCSCIRIKLDKSKTTENCDWQKLSNDEKEELEKLTEDDILSIIRKVTKIFIRVISGIINRYSSILDLKIKNAYRFGLQMRTLTDDDNVRKRIHEYLCNEDMDHVALTWIADEVTFWSMD